MTTNQIAYFKAKVEERHYNMMDAENQRHNVRTEQLTGEAQAETHRSNVANEGIKYQTLIETNRHNVATEQLGFGTLAETQRHNTATEQVAAYSAQTQRIATDSQIKVNEANITLTQQKTEMQKIENNKQTLEYEYQSNMQGVREFERYVQPMTKVDYKNPLSIASGIILSVGNIANAVSTLNTTNRVQAQTKSHKTTAPKVTVGGKTYIDLSRR